MPEPTTRTRPAKAVCTCSTTPKACPYHGENPTEHDTYAQHCKEHVLGTPAHGGGRCPLCDSSSRADAPTPEEHVSVTVTPQVPDIATLRGIVRMAALTVMDDVGETDKALATAIAAKAGLNLHEYLTSLNGGSR